MFTGGVVRIGVEGTVVAGPRRLNVKGVGKAEIVEMRGKKSLEVSNNSSLTA